jgi:hypothetical protein
MFCSMRSGSEGILISASARDPIHATIGYFAGDRSAFYSAFKLFENVVKPIKVALLAFGSRPYCER